MKTLATAQQKGGVGKTVDLVHIAHDAFERGLNVAVIDLDTQGNASRTLADFRSGVSTSALFGGLRAADKQLLAIGEADSPRMALIKADAGLADLEDLDLSEASDNFDAAVKWLGTQGYDLCLIDTPPSLGKALTLALYAADFVISPMQLKVYSMDGIEKMNAMIGNMREYNAGLQFLGMVPSMLDRRKHRQVANLERLQEDYPGLILPAICYRDSIDEAVEEGVPVWKIKKTAARAAAKEMRALAQTVFEKMGML